jgi:hypothetical protein
MKTSLDSAFLSEAAAALVEANQAFARAHPGETSGRQPVHTVYGGAQLFTFDTVPKLGRIALNALHRYAPDPGSLGSALGIERHSALDRIHQRVTAKLEREAVEDFRIDFEDGYGNRPDAEEDGHAVAVAEAVARGAREGTLAPFIGIRIKPLNEEMRPRSVRTLDLVHTGLAGRGGLPPHWVITIPKITVLEQVQFAVRILGELERRLGLPGGSLLFEAMVETPQIILDSSGRSLLPRLLDISEGRLRGAHFGTYDFTAGLNITAAYQRMGHPACDFAKHVMQLAFAGTPVWLSDGSTTVLPVDPETVHAAWRMHFDDVRHSLAGGFYQGWDLHPAQLVSRYSALYSFFLEGIDAAGARLRNFVSKAAQATLIGDVFDDAATGQGLLNFFLRGLNSGAMTETEALEMTGLTPEEFQGRSFVRIMRARA